MTFKINKLSTKVEIGGNPITLKADNLDIVATLTELKKKFNNEGWTYSMEKGEEYRTSLQ